MSIHQKNAIVAAISTIVAVPIMHALKMPTSLGGSLTGFIMSWLVLTWLSRKEPKKQ